MFGAIAGDIIGSVYEGAPIKTRDFPLFSPASTFTDDSVLSIATAAAILQGRPYRETARELGRRYPDAGYGGHFIGWLFSDDPRPYGSWGNGSAMRVGPVGLAFGDPETVLREARRSAEFTHDHPEGIKGAQAVALAVHLARSTHDKTAIAEQLGSRFGYDLRRRLDDIRPGYGFDVSCQGSVPEAVIAFLESDSYEAAVVNAVSLGGDSDTQACIAGAIAEAYYGAVPGWILDEVRGRLPAELWAIAEAFCRRHLSTTCT